MTQIQPEYETETAEIAEKVDPDNAAMDELHDMLDDLSFKRGQILHQQTTDRLTGIVIGSKDLRDIMDVHMMEAFGGYTRKDAIHQLMDEQYAFLGGKRNVADADKKLLRQRVDQMWDAVEKGEWLNIANNAQMEYQANGHHMEEAVQEAMNVFVKGTFEENPQATMDVINSLRGGPISSDKIPWQPDYENGVTGMHYSTHQFENRYMGDF